MDKKILKKFIKEGLSTRKIAKKTGFCQTTVRYWMYKYGMTTSKNPRGIEYNHTCCQCNKKFISMAPNAKFCSSECSAKNRWKHTKIKIETNIKVTEKTLKKYLVEKFGHKCQNKYCGWDWAKECIVEMEHIDGNSDNNDLRNLTLLCPNCHSQTETYKGKNIGNGRHYRRNRYKQGKSY